TIHRNRLDVLSRIESPVLERAGELFPNLPLKHFKGCSEQLVSAELVLLPSSQTRLTRSATQVQQHGLFRARGASILAYVHSPIEADVRPIATRPGNTLNAQFLKRFPVSYSDAGIDQWHFDQVVQGLFLRLRKIGA